MVPPITALQAFDTFIANITGSWCCHMPGEVTYHNVSSLLNYTMSKLGLDSSVFARWHMQQPPPPQRRPVEALPELVQQGPDGLSISREDMQAAVAMAAAMAAAAPIAMPVTFDKGHRSDGREADDPFVGIEGGGQHRDVG